MQDPEEGVKQIFTLLGRDLDTKGRLPYVNLSGNKEFTRPDMSNYGDAVISSKLGVIHNVSIISQTMGYFTKATTKFKEDGLESNKFNLEENLQLGLEGKSRFVLQDLVDSYGSGEVIKNVQRPDGSYGDCRRTYKIYNAPEVLQIQLKRFKMSDLGKFASKITAPVEFGSRLQLKTLTGNVSYSLYAVSRHIGSGSTQTGHYTAHIKSIQDGKWYDANDSSITPLQGDNGDVFSEDAFQKAYLLFYKRD